MDMVSSKEDINFKDRFEAGEIPPADFRHRDHLRLVYVYLCEGDVQAANDRMRAALKTFLRRNNVPAEKHHETITYSWVQAVRHFMAVAKHAASFDEFLAAGARLLDTEIMLSHYSRETLFADNARVEFVQPDIQAIPQYHPSSP